MYQSKIRGLSYTDISHMTNYVCSYCDNFIHYHRLMEQYSPEGWEVYGLLDAQRFHWYHHPECEAQTGFGVMK